MNNDHNPEGTTIPDSRRIEAATDAAIDALNLDPTLIAKVETSSDHSGVITLEDGSTIQVSPASYEAYL